MRSDKQWSDFMHAPMAPVYTQTLGGLIADTPYELRIYAISSFQKVSDQYLVIDFTANVGVDDEDTLGPVKPETKEKLAAKIMEAKAVENIGGDYYLASRWNALQSAITNPNGTIYVTISTASGLKYYELFNAAGNLYVKDNQEYPYLVDGLLGSYEYMQGNLPLSNAVYRQDKKPAFTSVQVTENAVTFESYNVDDLATPIDAFTVTKQAVFVPEEYTVTFVDDDGEVLVEQTVEEGKTVTAPADPDREGFTFLGWFLDGKAFDFETPITADLTLAARWEAGKPPVITFTVTFVDWDGEVFDEQMVEEGNSASAPADPDRDGYTFIGWDKDFFDVESDLTVTALYEKIPDPVVVVGVTPSAYVTKLSGNKNDLTVTLTVQYSNGENSEITETFSIDNNAANSYTVGDNNVYIDTKGNDQIRECYIVE